VAANPILIRFLSRKCSLFIILDAEKTNTINSDTLTQITMFAILLISIPISSIFFYNFFTN
jgi:hypothetical protein